MSIIAAYYYNEGKRVREIALDEHVKLGESRSGFCWIALSEPTPEELLAIQRTYNLHPLAIDNAMHPLCPPKLEVYNDELYVVWIARSSSSVGSLSAIQQKPERLSPSSMRSSSAISRTRLPSL